MGCIWSSEDEREKCLYCERRPVNNLVLINNVCEICTSRSRSTVNTSDQLKPLYGEYRCSCGRFWNSRYARAGVYQNCERCRKPAYPTNTRELRSSDYGDTENKEEHKKELCQMCQQLGYHCGKYGNIGRSRSRDNSRFGQRSRSRDNSRIGQRSRSCDNSKIRQKRYYNKKSAFL